MEAPGQSDMGSDDSSVTDQSSDHDKLSSFPVPLLVLRQVEGRGCDDDTGR